MKAVRFYGKHDLRTESAPGPGGLKPGQVLVRPTFCGICGTDLHEFESGPIFTPAKPNPYSARSCRRSWATSLRAGLWRWPTAWKR